MRCARKEHLRCLQNRYLPVAEDIPPGADMLTLQPVTAHRIADRSLGAYRCDGDHVPVEATDGGVDSVAIRQQEPEQASDGRAKASPPAVLAQRPDH